jgi:VWFA-related protein
MKRRSKFAALVAFLAGTSLTAGQAPPSALSQTPTFKVQVDYVDVDVLVTDGQGRFVHDLTRDDFQVFEDGKRQTIANFSVVDIPIERADRPLYSTEPIEADVESNEKPFEGRIYVLVLDDLHVDALRSQNVKAAARQFIERRLGANDVMAVVQAGGRSDAGQEFTSNKRLLLAAVDRFMGRKLQSITLARTQEYFRQAGGPGGGGRVQDPDEAERAYNAQQTMRLLKDVAEWFGSVRGRRKTILFVSEGIDYDVSDVIRQFDAPGNAASIILDDIRETIAATARSNVSIYGIDPRGLTQLADETIAVSSLPDPGSGIGLSSLRNELQMSQDSLRALSDETGGFAAVNTNQFSTAFDRIVGDNSTYYVLAYYPPTDKKDGKFHRIDVKVSRPGLTVRARRGYMSAKAKAAPKATKKTNGPTVSPEVLDLLNSPLNVSGLTMHLFAAPFKGAAPNASVLLGVELLGRDLTLAPNSKLELSYLAIDAKGKTYGAKTDSLTLNLRPETRARVLQTGFRMLNRMDLPPGRYQLRVAAHDPGGPVGSVLYNIEIPEYGKLPFSMSGMLLTSLSGASMITARADEETKTVLPAPPIAQRTFPQNDEIALFVEIYDDGNAAPHKVDIATTIRSDVGKVFFKNEEERASSELQGKRGGYGYTARIPLTALEPGPYVLTVEARSRLGHETAASRQVRVVVGPPVRVPAGPPVTAPPESPAAPAEPTGTAPPR